MTSTATRERRQGQAGGATERRPTSPDLPIEYFYREIVAELLRPEKTLRKKG